MTKAKKDQQEEELPREKDPWGIEIGARLALARDAAGYNQVSLAGALGISSQQLSNYENGWYVLPPEILLKIYTLTRITADWLYLNDPSRLPADIKDKIIRPDQAKTA